MRNRRGHVLPYDDAYAENYNETWPQNPAFLKETEYHIDTLKNIIEADSKWLDASCGTGYFLSHFNGIPRAGFDLSESMLEKAREANKDAMFFEKHDISEPNEAWNNQWDVVSCTGQPWAYLNTIDLIAKTVQNLYQWTKSGSGICILTPIDMIDMFNLRPDYIYSNQEFEKSVPTAINAIIWSLHETQTASKHNFLIYPNFDQWIRWFSLYFNTIEVAHWPIEGYNIPRRCLICRDKKEEPNMKDPTLIGL